MRKAKFLILLAILQKAMEQVDSILEDTNTQRVGHWKSNLYTIYEDIQKKVQEDEDDE